MTFKVKEFSTIRLISKDVQKSKEWYATLFDQMPVEDLENFVSFKIANTFLDITSADAKNPFSVGGSIGYWLVDDLDEVIKKAQDLGGVIYRGPLKVKETNHTIVQIQDPMGNIIGFDTPS